MNTKIIIAIIIGIILVLGLAWWYVMQMQNTSPENNSAPDGTVNINAEFNQVPDDSSAIQEMNTLNSEIESF